MCRRMKSLFDSERIPSTASHTIATMSNGFEIMVQGMIMVMNIHVAYHRLWCRRKSLHIKTEIADSRIARQAHIVHSRLVIQYLQCSSAEKFYFLWCEKHYGRNQSNPRNTISKDLWMNMTLTVRSVWIYARLSDEYEEDKLKHQCKRV